MQLRHWIAETVDGAWWSLRFDELLLDVAVAEGIEPRGELLAAEAAAEYGGRGEAGSARAALREHAMKSRWRRGERL